MTAPLLDLLERTSARLEELARERDAERFAHILLARRPEAFEGLTGGAAGDVARSAAEQIANKQLSLLGELPSMIGTITRAIEQPTEQPALRLMQVAALAYLVNPGDLLPDDMPAGYGFVDDSIVLRAMVVTVPQIYGMTGEQVARERIVVDFQGLCIPQLIAPELVRSVRASATLVQMLGFLPPALVEDSIDKLMQEPTVPLQSQPPGGMGWGMQQGNWFQLPPGVVEMRGDQGVAYRLDRESGVTLVGDELRRY